MLAYRILCLFCLEPIVPRALDMVCVPEFQSMVRLRRISGERAMKEMKQGGQWRGRDQGNGHLGDRTQCRSRLRAKGRLG